MPRVSWRSTCMARPLRIQYPGALYHVTSRGIFRQNIFKDDKDRLRFLDGLEEMCGRHGAFAHCYVLMSNHYHLMLETPQANLSRCMHDLNAGYASYIRAKWGKAGHVFQGRFKAIVVQKEAYLLELSRYIHLNPVKAGMAKRPEQYRWSSYGVLIGVEKPPAWLRPEGIWKEVGGEEKKARRDYRQYVEAKLGQDMENPFERSYAQMVLGTRRFVHWVKDKVQLKKRHRDIPVSKSMIRRAGLEDIARLVTEHFGRSPEDISAGRGKGAEARSAAILVARRKTGASLREIGERFGGLEYWAASKAYLRAAKRLGTDRAWARTIARLCKAVEEMSYVQT